MGLREGDIKTFDDHEGIYLLFLSSSSKEEEEEDDDCFFWKGRKRSSSFARTYLFVCKKGDGNMLALALFHIH